MPAEGYMTKMQVLETVRERTGYGRRVVERKLEQMEASGEIRPIPDPGRLYGKLFSKPDIERVVAALTPPPVE